MLVFSLIVVIIILLMRIHILKQELEFRREAEGKGKVFNRQGYWCYKPYIKPEPIKRI